MWRRSHIVIARPPCPRVLLVFARHCFCSFFLDRFDKVVIFSVERQTNRFCYVLVVVVVVAAAQSLNPLVSRVQVDVRNQSGDSAGADVLMSFHAVLKAHLNRRRFPRHLIRSFCKEDALCGGWRLERKQQSGQKFFFLNARGSVSSPALIASWHVNIVRMQVGWLWRRTGSSSESASCFVWFLLHEILASGPANVSK